MHDEVREAIESACTARKTVAPHMHRAELQKHHSPEFVRQIVLNVLNELPDYWTVRELIVELQ